MIDEFGFVDVGAQDWTDSLLFSSDKSSLEGCTINAILRGLFWIHSSIKEEHIGHYIPGPLAAWKKVLSYIFPCLTSLLPPVCLLSRVLFGVKRYLQSFVSTDFSLGAAETGASAHEFALGSLQFLRKWLQESSLYISDRYFFELFDNSMEPISRLLDIIETIATSGQLEIELSAVKNTLLFIRRLLDGLFHLRVSKQPGGEGATCGWTQLQFNSAIPALPKRVQLKRFEIVDNVSQEGDMPREGNAPKGNVNSREKINVPISVFGVSTDILDEIEREKEDAVADDILPAALNSLNKKKAVSFSDGQNPSPVSRQTSSSMPPISVFGVSADLWDDIQQGNLPDDSGIDGADAQQAYSFGSSAKPRLGSHSAGSNSTNKPYDKHDPKATVNLPKPRATTASLISMTKYNALHLTLNSLKASRDEALFSTRLLQQDVDVLELARQWTLLDSTMFHAIPMSSFQICELLSKSVDESSEKFSKHLVGVAPWTLPRATGSAPELLTFIDYFNAQSIWATVVVLSPNSPEERADVYERLIALAFCLLELNNFNGCMAIVSGLLQGSVTRLSETLSKVSPEYLNKFGELQVLMSGSKNFASYREEFNRRSATLYDAHQTVQSVYVVDKSSETPRVVLSNKINPKTKKSGLTKGSDVSNMIEFGCTGIVPHLGPTLSELVLAQEGSSVYLLDYPHLLNADRLQVYGNTLTRLGTVYSLRYWPITPLSPMMTAIDLEISQHMLLLPQQQSDRSRFLYNLSLEKENAEVRHQEIYTSPLVKFSATVEPPEERAEESKFQSHVVNPTISDFATPVSIETDVRDADVETSVSPASTASAQKSKLKWFSPSNLFSRTKESSPSMSPVSANKQQQEPETAGVATYKYDQSGEEIKIGNIDGEEKQIDENTSDSHKAVFITNENNGDTNKKITAIKSSELPISNSPSTLKISSRIVTDNQSDEAINLPRTGVPSQHKDYASHDMPEQNEYNGSGGKERQNTGRFPWSPNSKFLNSARNMGQPIGESHGNANDFAYTNSPFQDKDLSPISATTKPGLILTGSPPPFVFPRPKPGGSSLPDDPLRRGRGTQHTSNRSLRLLPPREGNEGPALDRLSPVQRARNHNSTRTPEGEDEQRGSARINYAKTSNRKQDYSQHLVDSTEIPPAQQHASGIAAVPAANLAPTQPRKVLNSKNAKKGQRELYEFL